MPTLRNRKFDILANLDELQPREYNPTFFRYTIERE